jgi:hypothetical protein
MGGEHPENARSARRWRAGRPGVGTLAAVPVTIRDIEALWGPATPHFAYQIATRLNALIADLPHDDPVRIYGERKLAELDHLGQGTSKGAEQHH